MKTLYVFYNDEQVGTLSVEANHQYCFQYGPYWLNSVTAFALSCSLPLTEEPLPHAVSYSFFSNLIPEGDLRDKLAKQLGLSENNDFGLLEVVGGDVAGAISLYPDSEVPKTSKSQTKLLSESGLVYVLEKLKTHPFLVNTDDINEGEQIRLSLAGVQNKLPIIYQDKQFSLPLGQTASTHILKPDNEYIPKLVINEAFCMVLAKACGLPVANVEPIQVREKTILLIERYDRENGKRLHQEDFCQAPGWLHFMIYSVLSGIYWKNGQTKGFSLLLVESKEVKT